MTKAVTNTAQGAAKTQGLTPRDDARKTVSEVLKRVDNLIKASQIDQARKEIAHAKEIDPKNVYVYAYEERIVSLLDQQKSKEREAARLAQEQVKEQEEAERRNREEDARRHVELERRKAAEEKLLEGERSKKEAERRAEEVVRQKAEEDKRQQAVTERQREFRIAIEGDSPSFSQREALAIYRKALDDVWIDGAPTRDEEIHLLNLRASLSLSLEQHAVLQAEVRLETYHTRLKRVLMSGMVESQDSSFITEYRQRFRISDQEHKEIYALVMAELQASQQKAHIMVIDDDQRMLNFLTETLTVAGFAVHAFTTTDDAYNSIHSAKPDLILSDINLETSTMGGFSFYEKVREIDELQDTPFIFVSGLTDEALIRAGKELGVDDYITKPFSEKSLVATIRGKLKRYRQLRDTLRLAS